MQSHCFENNTEGCDKSDISPSKIARIWKRDSPRPQITHERARIPNFLYITDFGDVHPKNRQQNRQTNHKNRGKRPAITP